MEHDSYWVVDTARASFRFDSDTAITIQSHHWQKPFIGTDIFGATTVLLEKPLSMYWTDPELREKERTHQAQLEEEGNEPWKG